MPKFGGFSAGNFNGILNKTGIPNKINQTMNDIETKITTMSPEDMSEAMSRTTVGSLASMIGSKAGINVDSSKIDGVLNRFTEARYNIRNQIITSILGTAKAAGYSIKLPNEESINKFIESSGIMQKLEGFEGDIGEETINSFVKDIDIKKAATDLGLVIEKVPSKFDSLTDANKNLSERATDVTSVLKDLSSPIGSGLANVGSEVTSAFGDIKNIVEEKE